MAEVWQERTLALAAVFQAVTLVHQLAQRGEVQSEAFKNSIGSLLVTNADDVATVFGDKFGVYLGLTSMRELYRRSINANDRAILRYVMDVLYLQGKLSRNRDMLHIMGRRIDEAQQFANHYQPDDPQLIAKLAGIYEDTLSTFDYRVQVAGNPELLRQDRIKAQVRALLLAGIRAAFLWRQAGGSRWQVIFQRRRLQKALDELLQSRH